jgi:hypothetical protein
MRQGKVGETGFLVRSSFTVAFSSQSGFRFQV